MLIIIEGRDGVGKTTFAKQLVERIAAQGASVTFVREPVDRACITAEDPIAAFAADRLWQFMETTLPALTRGETVVSDRSVFSSLAYQNLENDEDVEGRILSENASIVRWLRALASCGLLRVVVLAPAESLRPAAENVDANDKNDDLQRRLILRFAQVFAKLPPDISPFCSAVRHVEGYPTALSFLTKVAVARRGIDLPAELASLAPRG